MFYSLMKDVRKINLINSLYSLYKEWPELDKLQLQRRHLPLVNLTIWKPITKAPHTVWLSTLQLMVTKLADDGKIEMKTSYQLAPVF